MGSASRFGRGRVTGDRSLVALPKKNSDGPGLKFRNCLGSKLAGDGEAFSQDRGCAPPADFSIRADLDQVGPCPAQWAQCCPKIATGLEHLGEN